MSATEPDYDILIVGAGAAGLSAARTVAAAGKSCLILEARQRIGGRAWTDSAPFGIPFDRGCHWLHSASNNPFTEIADSLGLVYDRNGQDVEIGAARGSATGEDAAPRRRLYLDGAPACDTVMDAIWDEVHGRLRAAEEAGRNGSDVAAATCFDKSAPNYLFLEHWCRILSGAHPDAVSTLDLARYEDSGENWPVVGGYGALVAAFGAGLPVSLQKPVRRIDLTGPLVRVSGDWGGLTASAVIVTVSSNILSAGGIRFTPDLPAETADALRACPTGHAEKVAFLIDGGFEEFAATTYVDVFHPAEPGREPIGFIVKPFGRPLLIGHLGGPFARDMEEAGEAAMVDFARSAVADSFGHEAAKHLIGATATHWASDPYSLGAYSCALPGRGREREILGQTIGGRLFLAGEAVSLSHYSTAHGAYHSGAEAAGKAIAVCGLALRPI